MRQTKKKNGGESNLEEIPFEEKMKRLEDIIHQLEDPELGLEKGMAIYKEGALYAKACKAELEKARHELEIWEEEEGEASDES